MTNIKPLTALMVEDNLDHAELMEDAFHDFNIKNKVHHVLNGEDAIKFLRHEPPFEDQSIFEKPDIIFLDIRMPRQSGLQTLKIIKADEKLKTIPVVMISTSDNAPEVEECYASGASGYIIKPLDFDNFTKKMKELNYYWVLTSELPP